MATIKAVVCGEGKKAAIQEVPWPKLRDGYVIVKVKAAAVNPTDWKAIAYGSAPPGAKMGCDYAGIVQEVGSNAGKPFQKGDRIAGVTHGGDVIQPGNGSFAEYIGVRADIAFKIPDNVSFEEAASLGISITAVGQGLYHSLKLPLPSATAGPTKKAQTILIYGGSTATGILGVQFAKLSGLTVLATVSPRNFDYMKSLGADAVFDYNSPTCAEDIKKFAGDQVSLVWDCIGNDDSVAICAPALSDAEGGVYGTLINFPREKLEAVNPKIQGPLFTLAYDAMGEKYHWFGTDVAPDGTERDFMMGFWELTRELLENKHLRVPRLAVNRGGQGLEGLIHGLDELKAGRVSAEKLVYTL